MRVLLTGMSALMLCGCLGRANPDLLHARLREQQEHLVEVERRMEAAQTDLQRARREADQLRAELARSGKQVLAAEYSESLVRASKLRINSMMSGGLNRDDRAGDEALVAYLSLVDDDGEAIKLPGAVELTLIDPGLPESTRQVGQWRFTGDECRTKWTRGFTGAGYQFTVPLEQPVQHEQLVLHAKLTTADSRAFNASQLVRVAPAAGVATQTPPPAPTDSVELGRALARHLVATQIPPPAPIDKPLPLDDINDPPPPAVDSASANSKKSSKLEWDDPADSAIPAASGPVTVRESTNWTKDAIPQRR